MTATTAGSGTTSTERLACQIEMSTPVLHDGTAALESMRTFRRTLAATADGCRVDAVALDTTSASRASEPP